MSDIYEKIKNYIELQLQKPMNAVIKLSSVILLAVLLFQLTPNVGLLYKIYKQKSQLQNDGEYDSSAIHYKPFNISQYNDYQEYLDDQFGFEIEQLEDITSQNLYFDQNFDQNASKQSFKHIHQNISELLLLEQDINDIRQNIESQIKSFQECKEQVKEGSQLEQQREKLDEMDQNIKLLKQKINEQKQQQTNNIEIRKEQSSKRQLFEQIKKDFTYLQQEQQQKLNEKQGQDGELNINQQQKISDEQQQLALLKEQQQQNLQYLDELKKNLPIQTDNEEIQEFYQRKIKEIQDLLEQLQISQNILQSLKTNREKVAYFNSRISELDAQELSLELAFEQIDGEIEINRNKKQQLKKQFLIETQNFNKLVGNEQNQQKQQKNLNDNLRICAKQSVDFQNNFNLYNIKSKQLQAQLQYFNTNIQQLIQGIQEHIDPIFDKENVQQQNSDVNRDDL